MTSAHRAIWNVARVCQFTMGFCLGSFMYVAYAFLYDRFGGNQNPAALVLITTLISISTFFAFVLDIPCGALADIWGRRAAVAVSFLCRTMYFVLMLVVCFSQSKIVLYSAAFTAEIIFGIGYALFSGALTAWIVDLVKVEKIPGGHGPIISHAYVYNYSGTLIGAVFAIFAYLHGMIYIPFTLGAVVCAATALFCTFRMKENHHISHRSEPLDSLWKAYWHRIQPAFLAFRQVPIILNFVLMYALIMLLNNVVSILWPVFMTSHYGTEKFSTMWYVIALGGALLRIVSANQFKQVVHRNVDEDRITNNKMLARRYIAFSILGAVPIIVFGTSVVFNYYSMVMLMLVVFCAQVSHGLVAPCFEILANNYIPDHMQSYRATIMSMGSTASMVMVTIFLVPSGGKSGSTTPIGWMLPATFVIGACIWTIVRLRSVKFMERNMSIETTT